MTKYELIAMRTTLYKLAGTLGTWNEDSTDHNLNMAYDNISKTLDALEEIGYNNNWIDRNTNQITEDE